MITVVIVSQHTNTAYYEREEIAAAIAMSRHTPESHRVVPIYLDGFPSVHSSIPYGLRLKHGMVLSGDYGIEHAARDLLALLLNLTSGEPLRISKPQASPTTKRHVLMRWRAWVATLVAFLAIGAFLFSDPLPLWQPDQALSGVIRDENGEVLPGIQVALPDFQLTTITDSSGRFTFCVKASKQRPVHLIARKAGYVTYDVTPRLGNSSLNFILWGEK